MQSRLQYVLKYKPNHSITMSNKIVDLILCEWTCPITQLPIKDPVITQDGHTYQRSAIIQWLYNSSKSPQTGLTLQSKKLIPNRALKAVISKFTHFINQIEINYKKDFNRLQQIIQHEIKHKQTVVERLLVLKNQHQKQLTCNQKINEIIQQVEISSLILSDKYLKLARPLIKEQTQSRLKQKIQFLSNKHKLSPLIKQPQPTESNQIQTTENPQITPILQSPLLICFNEQSITQQSYEVQTLRHPFEYLLDTFKSQRQIKGRYQKNQFTELATLQHQRVPLNMEKFLRYDWKPLKTINLMDCHLNDSDWRLFVKNAWKFPNLRQIKIYQNKISQVRTGDLQSFSSLESILFYTYGGWTNPLSQESKQYLRNFRQNHCEVNILFQE